MESRSRVAECSQLSSRVVFPRSGADTASSQELGEQHFPVIFEIDISKLK